MVYLIKSSIICVYYFEPCTAVCFKSTLSGILQQYCLYAYLLYSNPGTCSMAIYSVVKLSALQATVTNMPAY